MPLRFAANVIRAILKTAARFLGIVGVCLVSQLGASAASAQGGGGGLSDPIEFAEGSFRLPTSDWQVPSLDAGRYAGSVVQAVRSVPGHDLLIGVQVKFETTDSAQEIINTLVAANSQPAASGWTVDASDTGQRSISGQRYASLTLRQHSDGGEVLDEVIVWVIPADLGTRHRIIGVNLVDRHPDSVQSLSFDDVNAVVASMQLRPVGALIASDAFSNPDAALLPTTSPDATHFQFGYRQGAYEFDDIDPTWNGTAEALFGGFLPFVRVGVDVTFATDDLGQVAYIGCRRASNEASGYRLLLDAPAGRAMLQRLDKGQTIPLSQWVYPPEIASPSGTNYMELSCGAPTVAGTINGVLVGSVDDPTYTGGRSWLGASNYPHNLVATTALFRNLVVTQN